MPDGTRAARESWYLLIHQLPPKPLYLRAKVRTLLAQAGALALKDSVYVVPERPELLPALRRIAAVADAGGGTAYVARTEFVERPDTASLVAAFRRERDAAYDALVVQVRSWEQELDGRSAPLAAEGRMRLRLAQARRRFDRIVHTDWFAAEGRAAARDALDALDARLGKPPGPGPDDPNAALAGRTWVTRRGVQIDRIASAWLVRRFVDANAAFRFIDPHAEEPQPGELTFDMVGADFTHEDDRCTFETLVRRIGLRDTALARVAEIVHDIDIKDGKFGRAEARGVEQVLHGVLAAHPDDEQRLARGFALLDDLYGSFARRKGGSR